MMSARILQGAFRRTLALIGLAALLILAAALWPNWAPQASAQVPEPVEPTVPVVVPAPKIEPVAEEPADPLTLLHIEGVGSRNVTYDGTVGEFTISTLRPSVLEAVAAGNRAVKAISDAVADNCATPTSAFWADLPECVSPEGLRTTRIRIYEEFDWTEEGRVSQGFRYENGLRIAILGTDYAGGLIDLVITAGGDLIRFDGLSFTASRRAESERMAMLDAIDDAQITADSIADHMGYEIVRIVEIRPGGGVSPLHHDSGEVEQAAMDESFEPTPVFGGSESVTSRVQMVFELRPIGMDDDHDHDHGHEHNDDDHSADEGAGDADSE